MKHCKHPRHASAHLAKLKERFAFHDNTTGTLDSSATQDAFLIATDSSDTPSDNVTSMAIDDNESRSQLDPPSSPPIVDLTSESTSLRAQYLKNAVRFKSPIQWLMDNNNDALVPFCRIPRPGYPKHIPAPGSKISFAASVLAEFKRTALVPRQDLQFLLNCLRDERWRKEDVPKSVYELKKEEAQAIHFPGQQQVVLDGKPINVFFFCPLDTIEILLSDDQVRKQSLWIYDEKTKTISHPMHSNGAREYHELMEALQLLEYQKESEERRKIFQLLLLLNIFLDEYESLRVRI